SSPGCWRSSYAPQFQRKWIMVTQQSRWSSSSMTEALSQPTEMVKEYPISSMLVVFGVGLGVGVLLAQTVCDSMIRAMAPEPTMMERLGRQMYETFQAAVPESLTKRMNA